MALNAGERLHQLASLAREIGAPAIRREADELAQRISDGYFFVACLGQFKRGKSTLLNALVGSPVLPVGVAPVTSVITVLRFGDVLSARIRFTNGSERVVPVTDLARYVSEEENHENARGVAAAEVLIPSPILQSGVCLVDTPGLGSVFAENDVVTRQFVPHVDAGLFVLGADPPISGEELALIQQISSQVDRIVLVLNKADRLASHEVAQAREFARRVVSERLGRAIPDLFELSATEAAAGSIRRDWSRLVEALRDMAEQSGASLVQAAAQRGVARIYALLEATLEQEALSLRRPLDESRARLEVLGGTVRDAEVSLADLGPLLVAEERRLSVAFERLRERFIAVAVPAAREQCRAALAGMAKTSLRQRAYSIAQDIASKRIDEWRREIEPQAEALYRTAIERFVEIGRVFATRLASADASLSNVVAGSLDAPTLRARPRFFHTDLLALTGGGPVEWLADHLLSDASHRRSVTNAASAYVERLLESNGHRLANDLRERVRESRRVMESDLRRRLRDVLDTTARAYDRAREQHQLGNSAVQQSVRVIDERLVRLRQLLD